MSVVLTEKAATQVKRYQDDNKVEDDMFLRVAVAASGCSGYSYKLEFAQDFNEATDDQYEFHGVKIVVDKKSSLLLDGTTIDWKDGLDGSGFHFENPNVTKSCGCGNSFQV